MRKIILILTLFSTLLVGCSVIPLAKPTLTTSEMATKVALLLTAMPTATGDQAALPSTDQNLPLSTLMPLPDEIGVLATPTTEGETGLITPTTDETAFAAFLGETSTPEVAPSVTISAATATPPITMPSATPTATIPPTLTPGGTPMPASMITATFTASDPRSLLPVATWTDTMDTGKNWPIGADAFTAIDFQNGYMVLTGLQKDNGWRLAVDKVDNAYIEVTGKFGITCHGMDKWGIMLRSPDLKTADKGYWFNVTCDGKFAFQKWNANPPDKEKSVTNLIAWTSNSNIKPGGNATNRLGVLAKGNHFTFYMNGSQIAEWTDGSYSTGGFGVLVGARETDRLNVYIDEMSYWLNPPM
jgi:hypothetical protein